MSNIPTIEEKCKGAMLGAAIGDALGWPNEFSKNEKRDAGPENKFYRWKRYTGGRYWRHDEEILAGEYSDDTQMILAVARSIITGEWEKTFSTVELPFWLEYERGGGRAVKNAARILKGGDYPWDSSKNEERTRYYAAGGNGAAMRILPHVIRSVKNKNVEHLMEEVMKNAVYTHGHPRAILGASCYAYALYILVQKNTVLEFGELADQVWSGAKIWGKMPAFLQHHDWLKRAKESAEYDYQLEWNHTVEAMKQKLRFICQELKKGLIIKDRDVLKHLECFDEVKGAGDVAATAAVFMASKYANNPALGIKIAAYSFGADTDTIASMTGGLLGMLCGMKWIPPEWSVVQDYKCLLSTAEILLSDNMKEKAEKDYMVYGWSDDKKETASPIGKLHQIEERKIDKTSFAVRIMKYQTLLGQTIYTREYSKKRYEERTAIDEIPKELDLQMFGKQQGKNGELRIDAELAGKLQRGSLIGKTTFNKVLKIFIELLEDDDVAGVAKKMKVDIKLVEMVKNMMI